MRAWFSRLGFWCTHRRICAWCTPKRYLGGNPLAKNTTDGICAGCFAKMQRSLVL